MEAVNTRLNLEFSEGLIFGIGFALQNVWKKSVEHGTHQILKVNEFNTTITEPSPTYPVYSDSEPITLMNLEPSTSYRVRVQLSRPGEGGEGAPGPDAIMETDCPGKTPT